jgi:hypothetical protein
MEPPLRGVEGSDYFWSLPSTREWLCWGSLSFTPSCQSQNRSYDTTDGQSARLSSCLVQSGAQDHIFITVSCGFVNVGHPLGPEDGSVIYSCCPPSPAQSFSGPSSAGLLTIFHCLRFEIPSAWRARCPYLYPQEEREPWLSLYVLRTDGIENTATNNFSIIVPGCCLATYRFLSSRSHATEIV